MPSVRTGHHMTRVEVGSTPISDERQLPTGFIVHARWTATAAGAGIGAHFGMLPAGGWMALAALAMVAACSPCAIKMWRAPSLRTAQMLVGMSLGTALLHGAFLLGAMPASEHRHGGSSSEVRTRSITSTYSVDKANSTHDVAMLVAMSADFAASAVAASWIRRRSTASQPT